MPTDQLVNPQDYGTGLTSDRDWIDAAIDAHLACSINAVDYIYPGGCALTVNQDTDTLNISEGWGKFYQSQSETNDHSADGGPEPFVVEHTSFTARIPRSGDIGLTSNAKTHIYWGLDQSSNNNGDWKINTDDTPPSEPYIKLGWVDTTDYTVKPLNRLPMLGGRSLTVDGDRQLPEYL